jgi:hypothetical protein
MLIAKLDRTVITGLENLNNQRDIFIGPNPSKGALMIACDKSEIKSDKIYDILGTEFFNNGFKIGNSKSGIVLDVSEFAEGIYLVQIQTQDFVETRKNLIRK